MDADLKERLLNSIEADRLVVLSGAGLSMSPPSNLPSAKELAIHCANQYRIQTGNVFPADEGENLEKLAEYYAARGELYSTFISRLIPRRRFLQHPNAGHFAIADFMASGVVECVVSTNVDFLIEDAAKSLGEPYYPADIDGDEALRANINETFLAAQIREPGEKEMNHERYAEWRWYRGEFPGSG
ncbi:MAG: hypothetical protein WA324_22195, partial [Bryobacteraceae bacterium]